MMEMHVKRWLARSIDNLIFGSLIGALIGFASGIGGWNYQYQSFHQVGWLFLYGFVEPALLCHFGSTPGKRLFGIEIVDQETKELTYSRYLKRSLMVYLKGLGCGFPPAAIVLMLIARRRLIKGQTTSWDTACQTNVVLSPKSVKPTKQKEWSL